MKNFFITGTDTNVGKTFVSCLILKLFNSIGYKTFAIKPIASGCKLNKNNFLENNDALLLQKNASIYKPYNIVNPIALVDPIAPHLAAAKIGLKLTKENIKKNILKSIQSNADINLIEGAGGWCVPLNEAELFADVIFELQIPVILVIDIKLGCLNHAILTYNNIINMQVPFIGWIANYSTTDNYNYVAKENIETLKTWIKAPCLAVVSYNAQTIENADNIIHLA